MRFIVDEMPQEYEDCPFCERRRYCRMSDEIYAPCIDYGYFNDYDCPYLITLDKYMKEKEEQDVD